MGTATALLNDLRSDPRLKVKEKAGGRYEMNSPFRSDSDSHSFCLWIKGEEYGGWSDLTGNARGSLYELADFRGIPLPEREKNAAVNTKRSYLDLDEYAALHGVEADVFTQAGWKLGEHKGRKALEFVTATGKRWRYLDGNKPSYESEMGYQRCWYGASRVQAMDKDTVIICNGEPSTIVAQHYGLPAMCVTSGEKAIPLNLIQSFKSTWSGAVWLAMDCDDTGRKAARDIEAQLKDAGFADVRIIDMALTDGGDLADFCRLHGSGALKALGALIPRPVASDSKSAAENAIRTFYDVPEGKTVPMPFTVFHRLRGFAKNIPPKKIVFVAAPSAGGKTSFLETLSDLLLLRGYNGMFEGKEWSIDEYHARRICRMGGITFDQWLDWQAYKSDAMAGIRDELNSGVELNSQQEAQFFELSNQVMKWRGQLEYINQFPFIEDTLADMTVKLQESRRTGNPITFAVFDYANVYKVRDVGVNGNGNTTEYIIGLIKDWTSLNNIVSFIGLQVTKDASKEQRKNHVLGADDLMFVRDWQSNLLITLNSVMKESAIERNPDGTPRLVRTDYAIANVDKNSAGGKGYINLKTNFERLLWLDETWHTERVDLSNLD